MCWKKNHVIERMFPAICVLATAIGAVCTQMWGGTVPRSSSVKAYIVLIYVVLPTMSSMAFSAFECKEVSGGYSIA